MAAVKSSLAGKNFPRVWYLYFRTRRFVSHTGPVGGIGNSGLATHAEQHNLPDEGEGVVRDTLTVDIASTVTIRCNSPKWNPSLYQRTNISC